MERAFLKKGIPGLRNGDYGFLVLKTDFLDRKTSTPSCRKYWYGDNGRHRPHRRLVHRPGW